MIHAIIVPLWRNSLGAEELIQERHLHDGGVPEARPYGQVPTDGVGGDGAFFLLLDEPEVYGLPPDPGQREAQGRGKA